MKKQLLIFAFGLTLVSSIFYSCANDIGPNPSLDKNSPYTDKSLLDSCKNEAAFSYYKNNNSVIASQGSTTGSPHGDFKLKFNKIATAALGSDGKLPVGSTFPQGSMVVKETVSGKYAFLYKKESSWLWGEVTQDGSSVIQSVNSEPSSACVSCHNRPVARDYVLSFQFY